MKPNSTFNCEYIRATEFRKLLNISTSTEWNWNKKGIIKPTYIGTVKYYKSSDIKSVFSSVPQN